MIKNLRPEALLLALAAFLAPVIGGHVSVEARPLLDGLIAEIFGGGALPLTARFLIALLALGAFALASRNRVVQIPNLKVLGLFAALVFVLGATLLLTDFRSLAFREWQSWLVYFSAFLVTVAVVGRRRNIRLILAAIGAGTALVALKGIGEYVQIMAQEPTYRIFADWTNPNAAASMFVLGGLVLLGLAGAEEGRNRLLALLGAALAVTALILTQSKGGYLAFGTGFSTLVVLQFAFRQPKAAAFSFAPAVLGAVLAVGLGQAAQSASQGGQALARITDTGSTTEQSVGFRQNLWRSSLELAQDHPIGTGIGTFQFYSTQPGLTGQTVHAHQSYLQLLAEGGFLAIGLFLALAVVWFRLVLRQSLKQPPQILALKATVVAAVVGFGAHGMVESNLSYFGGALCFFILLGVGLQLATDATSPESLPNPFRATVAVALAATPFILLALASLGEMKKATFMTALQNQEAELVVTLANDLRNSPFPDPEALYLSTFDPTLSPADRLETLDQVAAAMPTPKNLRAAARQAIAADNPARAFAYLEKVAEYDPANLPAGKLALDFHLELGQTQEALQAAQKLIEMEKTTAFQIRAIPEIVPTETLDARILLAQNTTDQTEKARLLQEAVDGYLEYHQVTFAKLLWMRDQMAKAQPDLPLDDRQVAYGPENLADAKEKLARAAEAATLLSETYQNLNKSAEAAKAQESAQTLQVTT